MGSAQGRGIASGTESVDAQEIVHGVAHVGEDVAVVVRDILVGGVDQRGIPLVLGCRGGRIGRLGGGLRVRDVLRQAVDRGLVDIVERVIVGVGRHSGIELSLRIGDGLIVLGGVGRSALRRQLRFLVCGDLADARIGIGVGERRIGGVSGIQRAQVAGIRVVVAVIVAVSVL